jgi:hypothetical protein
MFRRRAKGLLPALMVLLNLGSGPMAFAHSGAPAEAGAAPVTEHCGDHASPATDEPAAPGHGEPGCCAGGHCLCSAASTLLPTGAPAFVRFVRHLRASDLGPSGPASLSLSDPLRPPIA